MDSNIDSPGQAAGLGRLAAAVDGLAAQDLTRLTDAQAAARVLALRTLLERLEGQWLRELAGVDGRGAAGAEDGTRADSTAGWLRRRARLGGAAAAGWVRVARALHRGPLAGTARALAAGELSAAHAAVLAGGTHDLPPATAAAAEPVLLAAARRLDPPRLRRLLAHLRQVADPDGAAAQAHRRHEQRGLCVSPTFQGLVVVDGLLEPEAGATLLAALAPLARPTADDARSAPQRRADALTELARRALEGGRLPQTGGVRPQVTVTIELAGLLGEGGMPGGEGGWAGLLRAETCRRLACDAELTRAVVARGSHHRTRAGGNGDGTAGAVAARLRAAVALLPAALGGAPTQPLEVGRATRVVSPAQRTALAVRDGGCGFPGCDRPPAWCDAHHLRHWVHGGPTDLANLVLLCRAHHRAVHEGGWRLRRQAGGHLTATPPHRRHPPRPEAADPGPAACDATTQPSSAHPERVGRVVLTPSDSPELFFPPVFAPAGARAGAGARPARAQHHDRGGPADHPRRRSQDRPGPRPIVSQANDQTPRR
jgi:Domain of unknown function (DUF222)/HNH endonuclease